jgi:phosphatidylinositol alpha-mannosyltransferase
MKIGFVVDDTLDKPDGVQQYVLTLGDWLASRGHQVHYLAGKTTRRDIPNVHSLSQNIAVKFNQNRLSIPRSSNKNEIKTLLAKENFDVLHVQMPYSPLMAGRIISAAPSSTAVIGTFHIIPFSDIERFGTRLLGFWQRRNLRRIDKIVSVSEPAKQFAKSSMGLSSTVLPNVVDVKHFKKGRKIASYDDGKLNLVFLGRLVERKGALQFLEALQVLHADGRLHDIRVLICGTGPLEARLRSFVEDFHLNDYVIFEGFIDEADKPGYLATADIAVFPSLGGESFGIVLIEAMAAGSQTVLGGDNVGYASVLGEGSDQLVNPADKEAFAEVLNVFITKNSARKKADLWQQKHVLQYDVATVGKQLLDIYRLAIAKRRR